MCCFSLQSVRQSAASASFPAAGCDSSKHYTRRSKYPSAEVLGPIYYTDNVWLALIPSYFGTWAFRVIMRHPDAMTGKAPGTICRCSALRGRPGLCANQPEPTLCRYKTLHRICRVPIKQLFWLVQQLKETKTSVSKRG